MSPAGGARFEALPPELLLAAACCRWPPSPSRDAAVARAAEGVDWPAFLRVVDRQRVAGLVRHALSSAGVAVSRDIAERAQAVAIEGLRNTAETARLARLLDDAKIDALFLKGATLERLAYGVGGIKHSNDIDLLVAPADVEAVLTLVEHDGYRLWLPAAELDDEQRRNAIRYEDEFTMVHRDRGNQLDLHWRLTRNAALLPGVGPASARRSVPLSGGLAAPTLTHQDLLSYLAVHGSAHCWSRLKWLADFDALLGDGDPVAAYHHARALGVGVPMAQALLLAEGLLGRALPTPLAHELRSMPGVRRLIDLSLDMMATLAEPSERRLAILRITLSAFLLRAEPGFRWRTLALILRGGPDVYSSGFPRALRPLYPVLRVPLWLWRTVRNGGRAGALPVRDQLNSA